MNSSFSISVARDFSKTPGPRNQHEGNFSGELFLEKHLRPAFILAVERNATLLIDLDGAAGYATSFLEAAFGGLSREFGFQKVEKHLTFKSDEEPYLIDEITEYIREANAK